MAEVRVSLVIPCFQEEEALEPFRALIPRLAVDEVVFVDDGSTDGTAARLRALTDPEPRARVVTHEHNRGVGAALRTGLTSARGEVVVFYDADRTYPAGDIPALVKLVRAGADLASASPLLAAGAMEGVPAGRRFLTRAAAWCYRAVLGRRAGGIRTFTCGFRAWRREAALRCLPQSDGFPATAEMLGRALLAGLHVVEHPSTLTSRLEGRSKMRTFRALLGHLGTLHRLLFLRLRGARGRVTAP